MKVLLSDALAPALLIACSLLCVNRSFCQTSSTSATSTSAGPSTKRLTPSASQGAGSSAKKLSAPAPSAPSAPKPPAAAFINCHALETHTSAQPAVTIVVFNQRDKNDHVRLSELLKDQPGAVEIKTGDGKWHKATVARLKSCFGRGLLFLSGDTDEPKDREDFLLRFPPKSAS
jgi:hypothetical protein